MRKSRSNKNVRSVAGRATILIAAVLLPLLLTSCGKQGQGETKTAQKSEGDFLDKSAKPEERKYLVVAKPFFIAVANRNYAAAYTLLSSHAWARMSLNQFTPAQQDADFQQNESYPFANVTAEQFAYLMQYVEAAHGAPRAPKIAKRRSRFPTPPRRPGAQRMTISLQRNVVPYFCYPDGNSTRSSGFALRARRERPAPERS